MEAIKKLYNSLYPVQQQMFQAFFSSKHLKWVIHCSRRLGKTYFLCVVAITYAIKKSNSNIKYASVTQRSVKTMIMPIMRELIAMLPKSMRPRWNSQDGAYKFPNGSIIQVAGVNNGHADDLRGASADLAIIDESGFVDGLDYLITAVLIQQLISTGGRLLVASSSPLSPAHYFADMIHEARRDCYYSSYTIDDSHYDKETIELFLKESGGRNSTTARREYFNELIVDSKMAVVPEWSNDYIKEIPKGKYDKFYHRYVSADWGVRDKTGLLFGKYIFDKATLYIEQEWTCSGTDSTTKNIAENLKRIEKELGYEKVYRRVADNNSLITLNDLNNTFGIYLEPVNKDSLVAMVNEVRLWVDSGRLIVDPRCTELIACLQYGVFSDEKRKEFGRSKALGHYDLLASLVYMIRYIDVSTNPIPKSVDWTDRTFVPPGQEELEHENIKKIFNIR